MSDRLKTGYEMSHPEPGEEVVITGISGYFPECDSVFELQKNLFNKVNLVTSDDRRWKYSNTAIPHKMGKINKLDKFDATFFGTDLKLAHHSDLQSRLILERTYEAIIDAGMNPAEFRNTKMGIFIGCCFCDGDGASLNKKLNCIEQDLIGRSLSSIATNIAQWLGVSGPAYNVDSACSSATYALENAFKAIRTGVCDAAIVTGSNLCLHPCISMHFVNLGVLSPDGECKCFDNSANGYVRSEAASVILLQKAKDCRRVYAQIVYAKTNCDGFKDNGITYPSGKMQKSLLVDFYEECDIPTNTVEYIEAHGTGTAVGDFEEVNAIDDVMCKDRTEPCLIGSIKSNIGHTEGASGICSAIKLCIAYHSGYLPPNNTFNEPRIEIQALVEGRLKVVTEKRAWNRGLTCFSGFGFGGANGHILLKNFSREKVNNGMPSDKLPRLVCVSGRTKSSVQLILDSLAQKSLDAEEIRLWHAIHEKNIEGHKFRGFAVLKSTVAGTVELAHDIKNYRKSQRPFCFVYPDTDSKVANVKELMDIPQYASAIYKCDEVLKTFNVDLVDIITGNPSASCNDLHLCIATVAIQIGVTIVIRSIGVKPDIILGYGAGQFGAAYANGVVTAEEAIELAYYYGLNCMEKSSTNENKNKFPKQITSKNIPFENGKSDAAGNVRHNRIPAKHVNSNKNVDSSFTMDCFLSAENIISMIPSNAVIIQITPEHSFQNILKSYFKNEIEVEVNLIGENTENAAINLFAGLGRLFTAGLDLKLANLYPNIPLPVSQGTPMLSHLVSWDHREKWYTYTYYQDLRKLTSVQRVATISIDNPESQYLQGHIVSGRCLYPGSGYLVLVWETLAMMHEQDYKSFSVVFENIQYLRATTVPKTGKLQFVITIHPVSGEFEVTENKTAVVTGIIYPKKNTAKDFELDSQLHYDNNETLKLSQKDFYTELKLRDYVYGADFVGIFDCSIDGTCSRVSWSNNWVTYIDHVSQVKLLSMDTRSSYLPTSCIKLSIDTELHSKILKKSAGVSKQFYLDVFYDKDTKVVRSGGLEIRGLNANMVSNKADMTVPIIEKYEFLPNYSRDLKPFEEIIKVFVDFVIENTQAYKFKAIEIIDEGYNMQYNRLILEHVDTFLGLIPQVWAELFVVMNQNHNESPEIPSHITKLTKMPTDKSALLFVCANLSKKYQILKESESCLREEGYILSLEEDVTTTTKMNDEFHIIAMQNTGKEIAVLYKKKMKAEKKIFIKIDTFDQSFSWVSQLKETIAQRNKTVLYTYDDISGIIGFVNSLRREPSGDMIQCLFITDPAAPPFDPELPFYKNQLDKDLAFNIFKEGEWGTYRHILMKNIDLVKPLPHAYVNVENIGDLSTLKWFEGGLKESLKEKDENLSLVHVYCAALNFRDVMTATGRVSLDAVVDGRLDQVCVQGVEFAGKLANGMRVFGMAEKCISNLILCHKNCMFPVPDDWTLDEAASVFVAYSTVYMAFDVFGKMKPGESVLIHAGSGAVGQAAINVALSRGCTVFTTVGTSQKIEFIKKLYPQIKESHIGNSRDTTFEDMVMEQTRGKGVDLVLNSLAEDKLLASIRCLGRKGRFLEIGKYDIFKNTPIEMSFHNNEISFHGIMIDKKTDTKMLMDLMIRGMVNSEVRPLTRCTFEKQDVEAAYRYMASGKHIGKVIIKIRDEEDLKNAKPQPVLMEAHRRYTCHKDYVYVLVGGLGGFGLELVDWLVLRGARKILLVSSKGISTGYQAKRIRTWQSYGVDIRVTTDNVATEVGCKKILESALAMGHVEAIFNLAAILNDALFTQLSPELFLKTYRPKALATIYLDKLSRSMCPGLQIFVVFSSYASGRGNPGQTNYSLSNSVMEKICEKRKKDGLPAMAIQWGAIDDVGLVAEMQAKTSITHIGEIKPQRIASCLKILDLLMMQNNAIVSSYVVMPKKTLSNVKKTAVETVAQIIGIANLKGISYQVSLTDLGMDSISALEIKQVLERDFDIVLTAHDLRAMSIAKLISLESEKTDARPSASGTLSQIKTQDEKDFSFDFSYFIRNFGEEENAFKPFITMPVKSFTINENLKNKTLFMIPGLEGCAKTLEPLCRQLRTEACVLQLPLDKSICDLQTMTDSLYEVIKPLISSKGSFNLLGYSYGTLPLLQLAAKLESEGHMGTVFCIDGSPTWVKAVCKHGFDDTDDVKIQENVLKYVIQAAVPNDSLYSGHIEKATQFSNYNDKIDYLTEHLPISLKYSKEFLKAIYHGCNNRFKIVRDCNINVFKKIKSPIVLLRTEIGATNQVAKDYDLNQFTEGVVNTHFLKGSHASILEDPNIAVFIEKYLNDS